MLKKTTTVIICFMIVLLAAGSADAGKKIGRLIGKIVDTDGNPIEGVTVKATSEEVHGFNEIEVTDRKGVFKIDFEVIDRVYKYEFAKPGYVTLVTEQTWQRTEPLGTSGCSPAENPRRWTRTRRF